MIVSHRHKFVFIKTHKTAGSSLETALGRECGDRDIVSHMEDNLATDIPRNYGPSSRLGPAYRKLKIVRKLVSRHSPLLGAYYYEHMPAWRVRDLLGEQVWNSYFTFCFERNPWDKAVSYYLWKKHGPTGLQMEFADYIREKSHRLPLDAALYFDDGDDDEGASGGKDEGADGHRESRVLVDRVFEFRQLAEALAELRERLGLELPEPLPREKTGLARERSRYSSFYDSESEARIRELYSREIRLMGYQFEA